MGIPTDSYQRKQTIEWSNQLATGNQEIDSQHKELFERVNRFLVSCQKEDVDAKELSSIMKFMIDYVQIHFATEEALMRKFKFPGETRHKSQHEEFKAKVSELQFRLLKEGATISVRCSAYGVLVGWLLSHVQTLDRKLAEYLKGV